jgi:hypothetical protein
VGISEKLRFSNYFSRLMTGAGLFSLFTSSITYIGPCEREFSSLQPGSAVFLLCKRGKNTFHMHDLGHYVDSFMYPLPGQYFGWWQEWTIAKKYCPYKGISSFDFQRTFQSQNQSLHHRNVS